MLLSFINQIFIRLDYPHTPSGALDPFMKASDLSGVIFFSLYKFSICCGKD